MNLQLLNIMMMMRQRQSINNCLGIKVCRAQALEQSNLQFPTNSQERSYRDHCVLWARRIFVWTLLIWCWRLQNMIGKRSTRVTPHLRRWMKSSYKHCLLVLQHQEEPIWRWIHPHLLYTWDAESTVQGRPSNSVKR